MAGAGTRYMANDSATKAYPLNLGEALHIELGQAAVTVTVLVSLLVNAAVVARVGVDGAQLPGGDLSRTARRPGAHRTAGAQGGPIDRTELAARCEGLKRP